MRKALLLTIGALVLAGCQTRITATKNPETAVPIYAATNEGVPYIRGYQVLSGGWEATARSPLWADEAIKGLSIGQQAQMQRLCSTATEGSSTRTVSSTRSLWTQV